MVLKEVICSICLSWQIFLLEEDEAGAVGAASLWSSDDLFAASLEAGLSDGFPKNKKILFLKRNQLS